MIYETRGLTTAELAALIVQRQKTYKELSHQEKATLARDFLNHQIHFGPSAVCHKVNRGWQIHYRELHHPCHFKTKREAASAAWTWACALAEDTKTNG